MSEGLLEMRVCERQALAALPHFALPFEVWLEQLRRNAGEDYILALERISPHILEIFWFEGCGPSLDAVILHCESASQGRNSGPPR